VAVQRLRADAQHGIMLETTDGLHFAEQVVIAAGGYQVPFVDLPQSGPVAPGRRTRAGRRPTRLRLPKICI